jgi:hypothetical protein
MISIPSYPTKKLMYPSLGSLLPDLVSFEFAKPGSPITVFTLTGAKQGKCFKERLVQFINKGVKFQFCKQSLDLGAGAMP